MDRLAPQLNRVWSKLSAEARADLKAGQATPRVEQELGGLEKSQGARGLRGVALRDALLQQAGELDAHLLAAGKKVDAGPVEQGHGRKHIRPHSVLGSRLNTASPAGALQQLLGRSVENKLTNALLRARSQVQAGDAASAAAAARTFEKALVQALGLSTRRASTLLTSTLGLPVADRQQLQQLLASPHLLATRPLNEVVQATLLHGLQTLADKAEVGLEGLAVALVTGGQVPSSALQAAAASQLGAPMNAPRLVQDSRFASKLEVPFQHGSVLLGMDGSVHSVRCVDGRELPGDLLGALPRDVLKLARNLAGGSVVQDAQTQERGRALLASSWMAAGGTLDVADTFVVGLARRGNEPERFLYRMKEGGTWRPVPDAKHPVPYFGAAFLADDGSVLPREKLPPWAQSLPDRLKDLERVADPHVVGLTGPGESLPVTSQHGLPQTRDFMITTKTGAGTHLGLVIRRGDTGAYATAGGFVDKGELEAIEKAKAALEQAAPAARPAAHAAWMKAMFAAALRELMEEAFGKASKSDPAIVALGKAFDDAVANAGQGSALKLVAEGPVDGDFRRTEFGGMHTSFVSLEIAPELYRALERLAQGTDDAKFAGSIALLEDGQVGRHISAREMPFHHGMVRQLATQLAG